MIDPQHVPERPEALWARARLAAGAGCRLQEALWRTRVRAAAVKQRSELVRLESVAARLRVPAPEWPVEA